MQKLDNEQEFLHALPSAEMYERSYMHRDTVTHAVMASQTEFLITASADGHIKFWKKRAKGIEFAKHFRAHVGPVKGMLTLFLVRVHDRVAPPCGVCILASSHDACFCLACHYKGEIVLCRFGLESRWIYVG